VPHPNAQEALQGSWPVNLLREFDKERALVKKITLIEVSVVLHDVFYHASSRYEERWVVAKAQQALSHHV